MSYISLLNAFSGGYIALTVIGGIIVIAGIILFCLVPMKTWLTALFSGAFIHMYKLISLRLRKIKAMEVVKPYITAKKANLKVSLADIESLYLAKGDCERALSALIFAKSASIPVDFEFVKALELAGQNSVEVLESSVNPKVIEVEGKGITQDSIELIVKAKATILVRLENFLGGLGEDTISGRIQKKLLSNLALAPSHKVILSAPHKLATDVLNSGCDEGCAYQLKSIEIVNVDVGRDIGAEMVAKSAQKELALAQVESERVKNNAIIREQQMKIKTQEMKSAVLSAEAEVPRAIAEAIKEGRFSVMDYYKLMNLQADTAMRRSMMNSDDARGE